MGGASQGGSARADTPTLLGLTNLVEIGRGGDSTVYRAHQPSLNRDIAVKVLDAMTEADLRRFEREIRITVELGRSHPNIMKVIDTRTLPDGRPCILMDFYELGSAHDRLLATGPFSVDDTVAVGRVICDALSFAHSRQVLHRDVKPQNILILPTSYVLADFGIARAMDSGHTASLERLSYRHASPEVLDGQSPEITDDLWSLGSTLQTLLTGRTPFASDEPADDTALAYLRRVRLGAQRPLPDTVPSALRAVIDRALNPDRSQRYHDAAHMLSDLADLQRDIDGWAPQQTAPPTPAGAVEVLPPSRIDEEDLVWAPGPQRPGTTAGLAAGPAAAPADASGTDADRVVGTNDEAEPDIAAEPRAHQVGLTDPLAGVAPSLASTLAYHGEIGAAPAAEHDAAPTGLAPELGSQAAAAARSGTVANSTESRAPAMSAATVAGASTDAAVAPKTRVRIILIAAAMLLGSAIGAYFIMRGEPTTAPPTDPAAPNWSRHTPHPAPTKPVAGAQLNFNYPEMRPTLLTVKLDGNEITVTFTADNAEIANVGLVDVTHYDIATRSGPNPVLGVVNPAEGVITATLPAQDDAEATIGVVLVGYSADATRSGLSDIRWVDR